MALINPYLLYLIF